jgi:hypothetical protein
MHKFKSLVAECSYYRPADFIEQRMGYGSFFGKLYQIIIVIAEDVSAVHFSKAAEQLSVFGED